MREIKKVYKTRLNNRKHLYCCRITENNYLFTTQMLVPIASLTEFNNWTIQKVYKNFAIVCIQSHLSDETVNVMQNFIKG